MATEMEMHDCSASSTAGGLIDIKDGTVSLAQSTELRLVQRETTALESYSAAYFSTHSPTCPVKSETVVPVAATKTVVLSKSQANNKGEHLIGMSF